MWNSDHSTKEVTRVLATHFTKFGKLLRFSPDRVSPFASHNLQTSALHRYDIEHVIESSSYSPQNDGHVDITVRLAKDLVKKLHLMTFE